MPYHVIRKEESGPGPSVVQQLEVQRQEAARQLLAVFHAFALREAGTEGERLLRRLLTAKPL